MKVLVAYESRYGSTREIAERIARILGDHGLEVDTERAGRVKASATYDAFVIGSGVYYGSWLKKAAGFVRTHRAVLADRPTWLFSSGPIGPPTDPEGRDVRVASEPKVIAEFQRTIQPRGHQVFFGKLERRKLRLLDKLVASLPAFAGAEGDFRDWSEIETWAEGIAADLGAREPAPMGF